eukprot:TRINITY_DN11662_c0_g1_i1.p1 TRINITY_DN11662_c0_g1~~TRINITY_DN11662_c0_g1_i1.p1  ORF type:complete len:252 (+),score=56.50 TRINITY_DN11662_c0_g1_i1:39-758(+)
MGINRDSRHKRRLTGGRRNIHQKKDRPTEMGINRDSRHKRRLTGGRRNIHQKKRKRELGRQPAMTKIGVKRIHEVRGRGGNMKYRAMRLETGNFSWGSECCTRRTRILDVVYNSTNNELVRTKTLVKNCIIQVDAAPYRAWYEQHYGTTVGKKKKEEEDKKAEQKDAKTAKKSIKVTKKIKKRNDGHVLDLHLREQFNAGRLYAAVSSRPGQCGRADGYILEGQELEFYLKKLSAKKKQ